MIELESPRIPLANGESEQIVIRFQLHGERVLIWIGNYHHAITTSCSHALATTTSLAELIGIVELLKAEKNR